ncbi:MAG: RNA polymerase sigma factor [Phycisphaerales bacterium]|nr:MAG: RNA polymerase sigma factor [Phycisphaerales bacterium]
MGTAAPTDERLMRDFVRGDRAGFELLVHRHSGELFRFVYRMTRDSAATEELVQEVFLQVSVSAARFDPDRPFKPWLYTIAANKTRDWLRSQRRRRKELPLGSEMNDDLGGFRFRSVLAQEVKHPSHGLQAAESRRLVREIVECLRPDWREILVLAYFHRFEYRQIAEIIGIPLGTVKSRLHAAVASFAEAYRAATDPSKHSARAQDTD